MKEEMPGQKKFGEIRFDKDTIWIKKFDSEISNGRLAYAPEHSPFPHLVITSLFIEEKDQGEGLGSQLMKAFEQMCKEQNISATVTDGIAPYQNPKAVGMYGKRPGWQEIPRVYEISTRHAYAFNLQPGQTVEELGEKFAKSSGMFKSI